MEKDDVVFKLLAKWLMHEYETIGGNILQFVEMGSGKGQMLKEIARVRMSLDYALKSLKIFPRF